MANKEIALISVIRTRHKKWMGHIIRGDSLLKFAIEGRLAGKPKRGRRREEFLSYLKMGDSYDKLKRRAEDRDEWRTVGNKEEFKSKNGDCSDLLLAAIAI